MDFSFLENCTDYSRRHHNTETRSALLSVCSLVQNCSVSIAWVMKISQSCTQPVTLQHKHLISTSKYTNSFDPHVPKLLETLDEKLKLCVAYVHQNMSTCWLLNQMADKFKYFVCRLLSHPVLTMLSVVNRKILIIFRLYVTVTHSVSL